MEEEKEGELRNIKGKKELEGVNSRITPDNSFSPPSK